MRKCVFPLFYMKKSSSERSISLRSKNTISDQNRDWKWPNYLFSKKSKKKIRKSFLLYLNGKKTWCLTPRATLGQQANHPPQEKNSREFRSVFKLKKNKMFDAQSYSCTASKNSKKKFHGSFLLYSREFSLVFKWKKVCRYVDFVEAFPAFK